MPAVTVLNRSKVGGVGDLLFDTAGLRIAALLLQSGQNQSILPFTAARSIGTDAIMVENTAATEGATGQTAREGLRGLADMLGLPVLDGDGTRLGEVENLEFDAKGRLVEIEVRSGGILGMGVLRMAVPVAAIRMVGPKLITVEFAPPAGGGDSGGTPHGEGSPPAGT